MGDRRVEMKYIKVLLTIFLPIILYAQVICDKFEILWNSKGNSLEVSLDTDLPDNTEMIVSLSRQYWAKGSSSTYSFDYFSEKSTVVKWKDEQIITVDNKKWQLEFNKKLEEFASLGISSDIDRISDDIKLRMIVHTRQSDPRFGEKNKNLTGKAVNKTGLRVVEKELLINYPLKGTSIKRYPSTDPFSLEIKKTYRIEKQIPLMTELNPVDVAKALENMKYLEAGGTFKVLNIAMKGGSPWYQVTARDRNRRKIGKGWINCTALVGQKIEYVK